MQSCKECPSINQCKLRNCTKSTDVYCKQCNDLFFKLYNSNKECQRMCAWNNHYCWPGTCGSDGLTMHCVCSEGFRKVSVNGEEMDSGETTCQPNEPPRIRKCDAVVIGPNGEYKTTRDLTDPSECKELRNIYGHFQPTMLQFDYIAEYTMYIFKYMKPAFIAEFNFGITDTTIYINKQSVSGANNTFTTYQQFQDINSSQSVKISQHDVDNLMLTEDKYTLENGQAVCLVYEARAGGYIKARQTGLSGTLLGAVPYEKVIQQSNVCYRYDTQPPEHCSELSSCDYEPLVLEKRITRSTAHRVEFSGWHDPIPAGGLASTASSIESFEIRVNEVIPLNESLKVDYTRNIQNIRVNSTTKTLDLNLDSQVPKLYCLTLEVKDFADNSRHCRRFVLYDNSSSIRTRNKNDLKFSSASPETNSTWQSNGKEVCLNWTDYFYNDFYIDNPLLNAIDPDPSGLITGSCEQLAGDLPVTGTMNVYGITNVKVKWSLNNENMSTEITVADIGNQSYCSSLDIQDGDIYKWYVTVTDIAGNAYNDARELKVDTSAPYLGDIRMRKQRNGNTLVHYIADLSTIILEFTALDNHSGISNLLLAFSSYKTKTVLFSYMIDVQQVSSETCRRDAKESCYCPDIRNCEIYKYSIVMLEYEIHFKDIVIHNNETYTFSVTVINNAGLATVKYINVLVDKTPPEVGKAYKEYRERNDTNGKLDVYWQGFNDEESGLGQYRLGVATRCLSKEELYDMSLANGSTVYIDVPSNETSAEIFDTFNCTSYVSIIAINNADEPSSVVCIDGIAKPDRDECTDKTPPDVGKVYKEQHESNGTHGIQTFVAVYWQDFNDKESGLRQYRLGVATRCFTKEELYDRSLANGSTIYIDVPSNETSAEIFDTFNCTSYVSIIAINNIDEPSSVVCIEGIAKPDRDECTDKTPPDVGNVHKEQHERNGTHGIQTYVAVYWQGFNDEESGLGQYRLGVATRCLTKEELYDRSLANDSTVYTDVPSNETSAEIFDTFNCTSYVSIIAINNVDEPSSVVCIEGIGKPYRTECTEKTPPDVGKVYKEQHERNETTNPTNMGLTVSLSISGTIVVLCVVVVVFLAIRRYHSKAGTRLENRVSYKTGAVSFERLGETKDSTFENPESQYNSSSGVAGDQAALTVNAMENPIYNTQLMSDITQL
ncbi:uncharacterized protein LOC128234468 [Mya arenaria]|uniref:uncharacterized protein LOC128234468 n=1 Tax=Mya arenaria TaxID=6604 RepID=UPI0022DFC1AB|nr:uncharacterized protein LOC128234468 [Mya arenaria]XP_052804687.1 uncharacterized protein LOC128234468 [Mya arenaria]XP_052804688.1 uncharacterized protein LOC128234468 [Mya arenaria]